MFHWRCGISGLSLKRSVPAFWKAGFSVDTRQALRLSNPDLSQLPTTTTTPDDVFYLLKVVISRLLSTGSVHAVEKTLEHFRDVVDRDYAGVIKKKLDDVYRTAGSSSVGRGEKVERENRFAFIVSRFL
jgi:hypothetical protein